MLIARLKSGVTLHQQVFSLESIIMVSVTFWTLQYLAKCMDIFNFQPLKNSKNVIKVSYIIVNSSCFDSVSVGVNRKKDISKRLPKG